MFGWKMADTNASICQDTRRKERNFEVTISIFKKIMQFINIFDSFGSRGDLVGLGFDGSKFTKLLVHGQMTIILRGFSHSLPPLCTS